MNTTKPHRRRPTLAPLMPVLLAFLVLVPAETAGQETHPGKQEPPVDPTQAVRQALSDANAALDQGQGAHALESLRTIEALEPDNPWAWYFRGNAHRLLGSPYAAMEAYDRALDELAATGNPEPELFERIKSQRNTARRQVFNLSLQAGLAYDSNVTFSGDGTTADFISGRGDGKLATLFQVDYVPYITNEQALTLGARLNNAWHCSIQEFNFQDYGGYIRFTQRLSSRWAFDLRYDYDFSLLDNDSFSSIHAISPRFNYKWPAQVNPIVPEETSFFYRIEARDYLYDTTSSQDRDGFVNALGVEQSIRITPIKTRPDWFWNGYAGYQFQYVATEGSEFDRLANDFYLGLSVPIRNPWLNNKTLTAHFLAAVELDDYRNDSQFDRRRRTRDDVITTLGVVLSQVLIDDPERGDLILHGIFNWTDADSNVQTRDFEAPFSYDKIVAGFQLEWRF